MGGVNMSFYPRTNFINVSLDGADDAYTRQNYVAGSTTNDTLDVNTPLGVLGGQVASVQSDGTVDACDGASHPVGFFAGNAVVNPYNFVSAEAADKLVVARGEGLFETDVYETYAADGVTEINFVPGAALYSSADGFLTTQTPTAASISNPIDTIVAIVVEAPSTANESRLIALTV
jgi:hypothetical protein